MESDSRGVWALLANRRGLHYLNVGARWLGLHNSLGYYVMESDSMGVWALLANRRGLHYLNVGVRWLHNSLGYYIIPDD